MIMLYPSYYTIKLAGKAGDLIISNDCVITDSIRVYGLNTNLDFY